VIPAYDYTLNHVTGMIWYRASRYFAHLPTCNAVSGSLKLVAYGCLQTLPLPATPLPIGFTSPRSGCINKKVSIPCWAHQKKPILIYRTGESNPKEIITTSYILLLQWLYLPQLINSNNIYHSIDDLVSSSSFEFLAVQHSMLSNLPVCHPPRTSQLEYH